MNGGLLFMNGGLLLMNGGLGAISLVSSKD